MATLYAKDIALRGLWGLNSDLEMEFPETSSVEQGYAQVFHKRANEILTDDAASSSSTASTSTATATSSSSDSSSTSDADGASSGCVVCSSTPECPVCSDNEQCALTIQTCDQCPYMYCANVTTSISSLTSNSSSSSDSSESAASSSSASSASSSSAAAAAPSTASKTAKIGGITGGVAGFFFLAAIIVGFVLYKKWYKKKYPNGYTEDKVDLLDKEEEGLGGPDVGDDENPEYVKRQRRLSQGTLTTVANSVFTKASNVINVTYFPGVTTRVNHSKFQNSVPVTPLNNRYAASTVTRSNSSNKAFSIFSKETYFSDLENASLHGESINLGVKPGAPKLVSLDDPYQIPEEDDEELDAFGRPLRSGGKPLASKSGYVPGIKSDFIQEEDEEEEYEDASEDPFSNSAQEKRKSKRKSRASQMKKNTIDSNSDLDSDDSDFADSDEENIEFIKTQHQLSQSEKSYSNPNTPSASAHNTRSIGSESITNLPIVFEPQTSVRPQHEQLQHSRSQIDIPLELINIGDDGRSIAPTELRNDHSTNSNTNSNSQIGTWGASLLDVDLQLPDDFNEDVDLSSPFDSPFD